MSARAAVVAGCVVALAACGAKAAKPDPDPPFSRAVLIVFENHEAASIVGNPEAPTFNGLARRGAYLSNYYAVAHPSLPNYLALLSGSTDGVRSDCSACTVAAPSLAGTLTAAHRTWKAYAEGLPRPGWTGVFSAGYAKKHDPFLYFRGVLANASQRRHVVPFSRLASDLLARRLPDFSLLIPNLCDDMHDCPVARGDRWLARTLKLLLGSPELQHGVVFVTFDEGVTTLGGGGKVATYAVGPAVRPGATNGRRLSHFSLLATIEAAWGLPRLANSADAHPITGIWRGGN